jgi:hypothetical protein
MPGSSSSTMTAKRVNERSANDITRVIGQFPYRMALAGGWIDQPFISRHNPEPPGSMVVVSLEPQYWMMERCGMANSTRKIALQLWPEGLPSGDPAVLVRQLYAAENEGKPEPSGSQDMVGLIYPGISQLDLTRAVKAAFSPAILNLIPIRLSRPG